MLPRCLYLLTLHPHTHPTPARLPQLRVIPLGPVDDGVLSTLSVESSEALALQVCVHNACAEVAR